MTAALTKAFPDLKSLNSALKPDKVSIAIGRDKGGRTVTIETSEGKRIDCKLKNLEDHFRKLIKNETVGDKKIKYIRTINMKLLSLDLEGEKLLRQSGKRAQLFTFIRRFAGNFFRPSHRKFFLKIQNTYLVPKQGSKDAQEVYEKISLKMKDKEFQNAVNILNRAFSEMKKNSRKEFTAEENRAKKLLIASGIHHDLNKLHKEDESQGLWVLKKIQKEHPKLINILPFMFKGYTEAISPDFRMGIILNSNQLFRLAQK